LRYHVRPMRPEDVRQVSEIDHEAFPENWPPPNYFREMKNGLAHYLIVGDPGRSYQPPAPPPEPSAFWGRFTADAGKLFSIRRFTGGEPPPSGKEYVAGFAGIWVLADEAHLTNIAVRRDYQRQGIGELLLLAIIEMASNLKAVFVTLEVRRSNVGAQNLYQRYGFNEVGIRRGYYTNNHEDAVLMTTDNLASEKFRARLEQIKNAYAREKGISLPILK